MGKKLSLGTTWGWTKHVHPETKVAVFVVEFKEMVHGITRSFTYRVAPENVRTGAGGWRADRYDVVIAEAVTPEVFKTPAAAAKAIVSYHAKKVS